MTSPKWGQPRSRFATREEYLAHRRAYEAEQKRRWRLTQKSREADPPANPSDTEGD